MTMYIYIQQADTLINDVHDTLGKDRALRTRLGKSTDDRPLLGGLRIGKEDPEGIQNRQMKSDETNQKKTKLKKWIYSCLILSFR